MQSSGVRDGERVGGGSWFNGGYVQCSGVASVDRVEHNDGAHASHASGAGLIGWRDRCSGHVHCGSRQEASGGDDSVLTGGGGAAISRHVRVR